MNHQPEKAEESIKKSFENLRTDYIDLFLIHTSFPFKVGTSAKNIYNKNLGI